MSIIQYESLDPIEHILKRTEMYAGSKENITFKEYIFSENRIQKKDIIYSEALIRVILEPLMNAVDNIQRNHLSEYPQTYIKINIKDNTFYIENDGYIIPIKKNEQFSEEYNHSVIFGKLFSGSNFNENNRDISGLNGVGIKLTNIFSKKFEIFSHDKKNNIKFYQCWENNMKKINKPIIKKDKDIIKNKTLIKFSIDNNYLPQWDSQIESLLKVQLIALSAIINVKIIFNDEEIKYSYKDYINLYLNNDYESITYETKNHLIFFTSVSATSQKNLNISFVNNLYTKNNGIHLDYWLNQFLVPISKEIKCEIKILKKYFNIFVFSQISNPKFNNQQKEKLISCSTKFEEIISSKILEEIKKWNHIKNLKKIIFSNEQEKIILKIHKTKIQIKNLDNANYLGTNSFLFICEGDSAKNYICDGIKYGIKIDNKEYKSRDYLGIFPLTGKLLNVMNATFDEITNNKVIQNIIKICNLEINTDYTDEKNYKKLKYGKIILTCDSDLDGIHIKGLLINFFYFLFPTLFQRDNTFIVSMETPIAKINNIFYYDEKKVMGLMGTKKYYKGLGTINSKDVKETFGKKIINFIPDLEITQTLTNFFSQKETQFRKDWIEKYDINNNNISLENDKEINISDFCKWELAQFSVGDCKRSIPSIIDGFKNSQRKIFYAIREKKLSYESTPYKVAQLSGYVAEKTLYHHGEQNLGKTIIYMAQDFPGSNNIPLLFPDGQFGSRIINNNYASERYIYTKENKYSKFIYLSIDESLLENEIEDGEKVEYKFFLPIIPMILVNGAIGIGTGWSTNIPSYNPKNIIQIIIKWLEGKKNNLSEKELHSIIYSFNDYNIFYKNFNGIIEKLNTFQTQISGINKKVGNKIYITEIPIGMWIDDMKNYLLELEDKKLITFINRSEPNQANFEITCLNNNSEIIYKMINKKNQVQLSTKNLVLFNFDGKIQKYSLISDILDEFCNNRIIFYEKRKEYLIVKYQYDLKIIKNKYRFLNDIINNVINIYQKNKNEIINIIDDNKYDKIDESYNYLINQNISSFF